MIWQFDEFELDEARFELRRHGKRVPIAPKPLQLLFHLARRQPATVSRDELLRAVWPNVRVTSASLARAVLSARRALGNGQIDKATIRTIRGRGYAFAASLGSETSPAPSSVLSAAFPFVGRHAELALIEAALDNTEVGHGRLLFVSGEPGIGKSRLLDELATRATARRAVVVTGDCREDDGVPPYWPWPEILRDLSVQCKETHVRSLVDGALVDLEPSSMRARRGEARATLTDSDARFRLFHGVADAIRQAAASRLLVVLIEDLHWAGPGALHLLRFAGRSLAKAPVLIAMTYRSSGPPPKPVLDETVGELAALTHAAPELRLRGLSRDETGVYVRHTIGRVPHRDLIVRLEKATGGNPLFLRELVPLIGQWEAPGTQEQVAVPATVTHILRSQTGRLGKPARELVEIAAVVGRSFTARLLARATGRGAATVVNLLQEACRENLIEGDRVGSFRFRHDIVRTALLGDLRTTRRIDLHRRVAKAIESQGDVENSLAELAHHYFEASPRIGPEKAVHYATHAAEAARKVLDFDRAAQHYRQALTALGEASPATACQHCDLLLGLGEVLEHTGQTDQSREALLNAADLARKLRSFSRLGRAALAITAWQQVITPDPAAVQLIEDGLQAIGRRRVSLRVRLLAKLAVLRKVDGREHEAMQLIDEALAAAKRLRDLPLRCDVLLHRLLVVQYGVLADHVNRLALTDELLKIAKRVGNTYATLQCRRHRIALLLDSGDGAALDEEIEHFARESAAAHYKQHYVVAFRATRAIVGGQFEEARRIIDEVERLADPLSPEERRFTPTGQRVTLAVEYRDSEAVARSIDQIEQDYPNLVSWCGGRALVALDLGRPESARAILEQYGNENFVRLPRDVVYVVLLATFALVSWRLDERTYARQLYDRLLPHSGTHATAGLGIVYQGPVDWALGVLALLLERHRAAARHFEIALRATERLGAWPWHARTQLTFASLLAKGTAKQRERARSLAASAREAAARFGMDTLRGEAEQLTAPLGRKRTRSIRRAR